MKKNKKYWKKQAKYFENQYWDAEYAVALLEEQLRVIRHKGESQAIALEATKRELNYFRQRNIGKKVDVRDVFMPDDYFGQLDRPARPYTKDVADPRTEYTNPDLTSNHEKNRMMEADLLIGEALARINKKQAEEFMKDHNIPVGVDEATKEVIKESATLPKSPNTTGTSGLGYIYNTTIDFTKPKNKNRWFWNK